MKQLRDALAIRRATLAWLETQRAFVPRLQLERQLASARASIKSTERQLYSLIGRMGARARWRAAA